MSADHVSVAVVPSGNVTSSCPSVGYESVSMSMSRTESGNPVPVKVHDAELEYSYCPIEQTLSPLK